MAKKNLQAAAEGTLAGMNSKTQAQKIAQGAADEKKNTACFSVWVSPDDMRRWKAYQRAKKNVLPTHAAFLEAALNEYIQAHPVTPEEKAELLKDLDI